MTDTSPIALSAKDAALAAVALLAALEPEAEESLAAFLPVCPQLDASRAFFIVPLITDMARAPDGIEAVLEVIADALPPAMAATAYLLAAEFVSAWGTHLPEQMRLLERLGEAIKLDRLTRAALDSAALARSQSLDEATEAL